MGDPVTVAAAAATSAVNTIQQQSQARASARAQHAAALREVERRKQVQAQRDKQQRQQSKRKQASARAAFGARGVSSTGGSANALVDGIAAQTESAIADERRLFDLDLATLRENQRSQRRQSLLQTRNSLFNTIVDTGGQAFNVLSSSRSDAFGTGKHPGER